ncbi:HAUS augmin-like complex subunit 3 [Oopsacas minuta]|uniref:HAUS augmin-like complex subunit 3 n=1 Tax=Oopsacas minuta TaxID=111878 RepID=A0AAV7JCW2_9METZ|nr:HAUS augmin-like complex subunit 3 [Oopsacas minuta]
MDRKVLESLRETLSPDQSELMSIAERLAECCDEDPCMPAGCIQFLNTLCSHFPLLVKRGDIPLLAHLPEPIPTKEDLDRILHHSYLPPPETEEEKREQQEKIVRANKRRAYLLNIKKCLEKQVIEMKAEKANLELQKEHAIDRTNKAMAVLAVQVENFNQMASSLLELVKQLNERLDPETKSPPLFFCQVSMDSFFEAQNEYTNELNNFCKKAFSMDLKEMREMSPEEAAVRLSGGRPRHEVNLDPKILQAQSMKSLGLMKVMRLELELNKMKSQSECLTEFKDKAEKLKKEGDEKAIRILTVSTHDEILQAEDKFKEECKDIPRQVEEIAMSEIGEILEGEMKHRIAQQKEVINRQERFMEYVKYQSSMYLLVSYIYEVENKKMEELHQCIQSVKSMFDETSETSRLLEEYSREARESDIGFTEDAPRLIIPSSDRSLNRLYKLMGLENKSRFPTYEVLREAISNLQIKMRVAEQRSDCIKKSNLALVLNTEHKLKQATETIKEFEEQAGQLVNGPEGRHYLEERLQEFERKMKEVLQTVNSHKQELIQHPTLALERRMAAVYHTDPQLYTQLKHKLENIKQNL